MTEPRMYTIDELEAELQEVDQALSDPVTAYLIGGGAMSFADLKAATKDIDVVVEDDPAFQRLTNALERAGYTTPRELPDAYASLGAAAYYDKEDAPRWDIYVRQVCNRLLLSPGMADRSTRVELELATLTLQRVDPADVFIFKSITEREADREDMEEIFAQGLDWETVLEEMRWQSDHSERAWAASFYTSMQAFADEGRSVPILEELFELADVGVGEARVLQLIQDGMTEKGALVEAIGEDPGWVQDVIAGLVEKGRIREHDGELRRIPSGKT